MSDVMISYRRTDRDFVDKLAKALTARQLDVWYDKHIDDGADFTEEILQRIVTSTKVLVVWSTSASKSKWVRSEAARADKHGKILQFTIEACELPPPFDQIQCRDLSTWNGNPNDEEIDRIVASVKLQPVAARPPSNTSDDEFNETRKVLLAEARIDVLKYLAKGEVSSVYLGRYGTHLVSVKTINGTTLLDSNQRDLSREAQLAASLVHPSFLRLARVIFSKDRCYIVTNYTDGETIARHLSQSGAFSVADVVEIMNQLCEAVAEAHQRGLRYLRIVPSEIYADIDKFIERRIVRIAPINFTYYLERLQSDKNIVWQNDSSPFMAPELFDYARFNAGEDANLMDEAANDAISRKANQFALGMLAWTMLEGKIPFSASERQPAYSKIQKFMDESETFSDRVSAAEWSDRARALARIIARMVSTNPADRWHDMKQVKLLVGALAADHGSNQLEDIVKGAYQSACSGRLEFYQRFYESFFRRAPVLRAKFPSDMNAQHRMLDYALGQLLNYSQEQSEPTVLTQFVASHGRLGLSSEDFKLFGTILIDTLAAELPDDAERERTIAALEIKIWPGIYYLMQKCAQVPVDVKRASLA